MSFRQKTRLERILNGQSLTPRSGLEEAVQTAMQNAGRGPMVCTVIYGKDATTGKTTLTLDKTPAEVFEAALQGRCVQFSVEASGMTIVGVIPMEVFHGVSDDAETYTVKARADSNGSDTLFMAENLSGSDTIVLTEV